MSSSGAINFINAINECAEFVQWIKSAVSWLHFRWSGSQEKDIQGQLLHWQSVLQRLRDTLPVMYDLIDGAEWRSHEHCVAELLPKLKDAVYDADDLLDEFSWHEKKVQLEGTVSNSAIIEFFDTVIEGNFNKLTDVQERLDRLNSQLEKMGLHEVTPRFHKAARPETSSLPRNEAKIFGRGKEWQQVMQFLRVPTSSKRKRESNSVNASTSRIPNNESRILSIPVLPIVGIGGVGKTTLAQHICNNEQVKKHFEKVIWICVSDDFDVKRLTKEVIESCTGKKATTDILDLLQNSLMNHVNNKRFLIVLDDMWDDALKENGDSWKTFCTAFETAQEGSMMLVTTRSPQVAKVVGTMEPITLEGLEEDVFWSFFKLCAFGSESSNNDSALEDIGRKILPKLKGSPLAAKTLGRMLRMNDQASRWNAILESELWKLPQEVTEILPALRLSYMYLPFHLKQCFSFCAVYPKDYKFRKEDLSEIWVAEGFVEPQGDNPIQNIAFQYFEDLVARSFFQKVSGRYVIHDLLHDMAQKVSEHDCFILRNKKDLSNVPPNVRHIYVQPSSDFDNSDLLSLCKCPKLRTLICKKQLGGKKSSVMDNWCRKLLRIRVMSCASTNELPVSIGNLKHLRYLKISIGCPLSIPPTLSQLYNLQILDVRKCKIETLPDDFSNLSNLLRFAARGFSYTPVSTCHINAADLEQVQGFRLMKNLRSLLLKNYLGVCLQSSLQPYIINLNDSICIFPSLTDLIISECQNLSSLEGFLHPDYVPAIKKISLRNCRRLSSVTNERFGDLKFLEELDVDCCPKISSPNLVSPSLKQLKLGDCGSLLDNINCTSLTNFTISRASVTSIKTEGWILPAVQELKFQYCHSLTSIGVSSGMENIRALSNLNFLEIFGCFKLSAVNGLRQEYLPAIATINVKSCHALVSLPGESFRGLSSLKHLLVDNCARLIWESGLVLPSSLESLGLVHCGDFSAYVPGCLENLPSLLSLKIIGCQGMISIPGTIWRNNLPLLEELVIQSCPNTVSIGGAKAVAKVKKVEIKLCPKLKEAKQIMRVLRSCRRNS